MYIHADFVGGNICIKQTDGDKIYLERDLRDTVGDWFYWAFCVKNAGGKTLTFFLENNHRIGYYGPAVSHDLQNWHWLAGDGDAHRFSYTFAPDENEVYFAHHMLYHPQRFDELVQKHGLQTTELCKSRKGRSVPLLRFGSGEKLILLTARHHACESTGNYVLEGVLEELINTPMDGYRVFCVPFVDYDGVVDGDQGKNRAPHDHNLDYNADSIYPEVQAIKELADKNGCTLAFDFHAPWHLSGVNDKVFIVQNNEEKTDRLNRFGELLEASISDTSMRYSHSDDYPPNKDWNITTVPIFNRYMDDARGNDIAFVLETAYFGEADNVFSQSKAVELGRCFATAIRKYVAF